MQILGLGLSYLDAVISPPLTATTFSNYYYRICRNFCVSLIFVDTLTTKIKTPHKVCWFLEPQKFPP